MACKCGVCQGCNWAEHNDWCETEQPERLEWMSVVDVLTLLQDGYISKRKAHEALNNILYGDEPLLPTPGKPVFDEDEMPSEAVQGLRDELSYIASAIPKSYYAGLPLPERVEMVWSQFQHALRVIDRLEERLGEE